MSLKKGLPQEQRRLQEPSEAHLYLLLLLLSNYCLHSLLSSEYAASDRSFSLPNHHSTHIHTLFQKAKVYLLRLLWWLSGKELACQSGDTGLIPGSGRSPEEENGSPLQYSCLGNLLGRGHWWATVHGVLKELDTTDRTEWKFTCLHIRKQICWKCVNSDSKFLLKKKKKNLFALIGSAWPSIHSSLVQRFQLQPKRLGHMLLWIRDSALHNSRGHFSHYVMYVCDAQWWCAMSNPQLWSNSTRYKDPTNYSC